MVSVIVPNYNHAQFLHERIESILKQTYTDFELILLDDCSTDDSKVILESYKNNPHVTKIIYNDNNGGSPFSQWNKGIELAQGEWIWIAESDDVANRYFLEELITQAEVNSNIGLVYSHLQWINSNGQVLYTQYSSNETCLYSGEDFIINKLLYSTTIFNVSSCIFKKSIFEQINHSLYKNMKMCGDYFFYVLISELCDVLEVCKVLDNYRIHNNNTSTIFAKNGFHWIEQLPILDYITKGYNIKQSKYSLYYARALSKLTYNRESTLKILCQYSRKHQLLVMYWFLFKIWRQIKQK